MNQKGIYEYVLQQPWNRLLDILVNDGELSSVIGVDKACTPDIMNNVLNNKFDDIYNNIDIYNKKPNPTSLSQLEKEVSNKKTLTFIKKICNYINIDEMMVKNLYTSYISLYNKVDIQMNDMRDFYFSERRDMLNCICAIIRLSLTDNMEFSKIAKEYVNKLIKDKVFNQHILSQCNNLIFNTEIPNVNNINFDQACLWADQYIIEQYLYLEILLLLIYYMYKYDYSIKNLLDIIKLLDEIDFGMKQPLYTYLSLHGREYLLKINQLCILIYIKLLNFNQFFNIYQNIQQAVQKYNPNELNDVDELKNIADKLSLELHQSHIFLQHDYFLKFDQLYFESFKWVKKELISSGIITFNWCLFISVYYELKEYFDEIDLKLLTITNQQNNKTAKKPKNYQLEKEAIARRLSYAFQLQPFENLLKIVISINNMINEEGPDPIVSSYIIYKDIIKDMLWCLFKSYIYPIIENQYTLINEIFIHTFSAAPELSYQVWLNINNFIPPLLVLAKNNYNHNPILLLRILSALAGHNISFIDDDVRLPPLELINCVVFSLKELHHISPKAITNLILQLKHILKLKVLDNNHFYQLNYIVKFFYQTIQAKYSLYNFIKYQINQSLNQSSIHDNLDYLMFSIISYLIEIYKQQELLDHKLYKTIDILQIVHSCISILNVSASLNINKFIYILIYTFNTSINIETSLHSFTKLSYAILQMELNQGIYPATLSFIKIALKYYLINFIG